MAKGTLRSTSKTKSSGTKAHGAVGKKTSGFPGSRAAAATTGKGKKVKKVKGTTRSSGTKVVRKTRGGVRSPNAGTY